MFKSSKRQSGNRIKILKTSKQASNDNNSLAEILELLKFCPECKKKDTRRADSPPIFMSCGNSSSISKTCPYCKAHYEIIG